MIYLLILPYCLTTILLYLSFTFFHTNHFTLMTSFILGLIIPWIIFKKSLKATLTQFKKSLTRVSYWPTCIFILIFIIAIAGILSPLIRYPVVNQTKFIMFTSAIDYYKHLYTITAIKQQGLPPIHPYFPPGNMSYYYGYYLIPAALSLLLPIAQTTILFFYVISTTLISFVILYSIYQKYLKSPLLLLFAFIILIFSRGWDIIPTKISPPGFMHYIELWAHESQMGLAVNNLYTAFLWVPQHILAATITLLIIYLLINKPKTHWLILSTFYVYVFLSSIFVGLTLIFWTALIFIYKSHTRKPLIISTIITSLILIPFIIQLGPRSSNLSYYHLQGFNFINSAIPAQKTINLILSLISEYGIVLLLLPFILIANIKKFSVRFLLLVLAVYTPIIITWFIKSPRANDFAMRIIHPSQLALPLIILLIWKKLPTIKWKTILIAIITINLMGSTPGLIYEYAYRWKDRLVLDPYTSELLFKIRQLPSDIRLASFGRDDWIFNIPPLGFKPILNNSLFDAGVYVIGNPNGSYEGDSLEIFSNTHSAPDLTQLVASRNYRFQQLPDILTRYPYDYLILNHKIWVKQGQNPWINIFKSMNVKHQPLTDHFCLWQSDSLISQTSKYQIYVQDSDYRTITLTDHHFDLTPGLWFIASCGPDNSRQKLEFANYYTLYDHNIRSTTGCVGNLFYLPPDAQTPVEVSQESLVDTIYAFPVIIQPISQT